MQDEPVNLCSEQPLWSRANDTLNLIRDDLMVRASTIEGELKRLQDEYVHVRDTLARIAPVPDQQMTQPTPLGAWQNERRW